MVIRLPLFLLKDIFIGLQEVIPITLDTCLCLYESSIKLLHRGENRVEVVWEGDYVGIIPYLDVQDEVYVGVSLCVFYLNGVSNEYRLIRLVNRGALGIESLDDGQYEVLLNLAPGVLSSSYYWTDLLAPHSSGNKLDHLLKYITDPLVSVVWKGKFLGLETNTYIYGVPMDLTLLMNGSLLVYKELVGNENCFTVISIMNITSEPVISDHESEVVQLLLMADDVGGTTMYGVMFALAAGIMERYESTLIEN